MADTKKIKVAKKDKDMNALSPMANAWLNVLLIVSVIITVIPLWVIVAASFTSEAFQNSRAYSRHDDDSCTEIYSYAH